MASKRSSTVRAKLRPAPTRMHTTEAAWAAELAARKRSGDLVSVHFEAWGMRLGDRCVYWPDFIVQTSEGFLEAHEVKGFWRDDARVKIKAAATRYPGIRFIAIQRGKKGEPVWKIEEIKPHG